MTCLNTVWEVTRHCEARLRAVAIFSKGLVTIKCYKTFKFIKKNLQTKKKSVPLQSDSKKLF